MRFLDISTDTNNTYRLKKNEKAVFFLLNRFGSITFELIDIGAEAHIFALFTGKNTEQKTLSLVQKHSAPNTVSHAIIKTALFDKATFSSEGLIKIEKKAAGSDASYECRALLLSPFAQASAKPTLEILTNNVKCHHAAAIASFDPKQLFFAQSRGLSKKQAQQLLVDGFFNETLEKMEELKIT